MWKDFIAQLYDLAGVPTGIIVFAPIPLVFPGDCDIQFGGESSPFFDSMGEPREREDAYGGVHHINSVVGSVVVVLLPISLRLCVRFN